MFPCRRWRWCTSFLSIVILHHHNACAYSVIRSIPASTTKCESILSNELYQKKTYRREFFAKTFSVVSAISFLPASNVDAANTDILVTQKLKVTPISNTFVCQSSPNGGATKVKPLRENDATRYLTNARVVVFFEGADSSPELLSKITKLTEERKSGKGPGVTPGKIVKVEDSSVISSGKIESLDVATILETLPDSGDVIFLPPVKSHGTSGNAAIISKIANSCGLNVGGARGGGVISVLVGGPRDPEDLVVVSEDGSETSTIIWYDV
mmetsp:Transcript_3544/g.4932  ORF Transcript_3544/g.4932 Transcript_3544/m.4932 type:complete len:268 (-) Transcript_3544:118-921(-)|eukprot:CAMPEP_0184864392 /NCGR_PEP_ID=MMETSP0580-20130426/14790_1 /TAXON_ID=1118495 /ORGANISM="Dactyliosolen fragilissimus" /LENGTH=267 /DNA_ID=CAMNT_0027363147 /DNA_START=36 /DNA_END=839 /DNA_ORIENTATION=+